MRVVQSAGVPAGRLQSQLEQKFLVALGAGLLTGWVWASRRALDQVRASAVDAGVAVSDEAGARKALRADLTRSLARFAELRDTTERSGVTPPSEG